ncbi:MAG: tetratricopeptide repeat-containing sensor histidine kinase [Flavobacteriaceae bacterium]
MLNNILKFKLYILILLQLLLSCAVGVAQNFADKTYYLVDSLDLKSYSEKDQNIINDALVKYHAAESDSLKIDAIYSIMTLSKNENIWGKYNLWLINFMSEKKESNAKLKAVVYANQSKYQNTQGHYSSAIDYQLKSISYRHQLEDKLALAHAYDDLGDLYKKNGDFINSLASYKKSLSLFSLQKNTKLEGQMLNTIGYLHLNFGMHTKALEYFHESLKVRERIDDKRGMSFCYNNIASVYRQQGNIKAALEFYHKSLQLREAIGYQAGMSISLNNIGVVYKNVKDWNKALEYYHRSLVIKKKLKQKKGTSHVLNNIGTIYKEQGKLDMAMAKYEESLKMTTALHDEKWMAITLFNMGSIHLTQGNALKAEECALRSLKLSQKIGHPELVRDASEVLKNVYSKQKLWQKAFSMQELYVTMRDSIRNANTEAAASEQRITYEVEKREQEIKLLSVQNDVLQRDKEVQQLKLNKNRIVNGMFLVAGIVALLLAVFFYMVSKKSKAVNKLLKKQDDEKKVMLKEIHHRVKNNLQVVNSLLRLQSKEIKDQEIVSKFRETQKRIITIAALHEKMYRSENLKYVNLKEHIESIVEDLVTTYAIDKTIDVKIDIEDTSIGLRTLVPLGLIINEIIVNSLKYAFVNQDTGIIHLQIHKREDQLFEMVIRDNGIGIHSYENSPGLGSKLINIFTKQLNGKIDIIDDKGTTYKINFEQIDPQ